MGPVVRMVCIVLLDPNMIGQMCMAKYTSGPWCSLNTLAQQGVENHMTLYLEQLRKGEHAHMYDSEIICIEIIGVMSTSEVNISFV